MNCWTNEEPKVEHSYYRAACEKEKESFGFIVGKSFICFSHFVSLGYGFIISKLFKGGL